MTEESNKALNRCFVEEVINQGNLDAVGELIDSGAVDHAAPEGLPAGREGARQFATMMRSAFPELLLTIEEMIGFLRT